MKGGIKMLGFILLPFPSPFSSAEFFIYTRYSITWRIYRVKAYFAADRAKHRGQLQDKLWLNNCTVSRRTSGTLLESFLSFFSFHPTSPPFQTSWKEFKRLLLLPPFTPLALLQFMPRPSSWSFNLITGIICDCPNW